MINRILSRVARLFVGSPSPLPLVDLDPHERALADLYGVRPDVPRPSRWLIGAAVASCLVLGCGPTATEAAVRDLHRIGDECSENAARIAETATSRDEGTRLLAEEAHRCQVAACGYCAEHHVDCAAHNLACSEVTP